MRILILMSVIFCGTFCQESRNIFLFPRQTATDHVILKPTVEKALKQLTVCLRSYTEHSRGYHTFSIAAPGSRKDNTFLIYSMPPRNIFISINNEDLNFKVDPEVLDWRHTCVTWDSETGLLQLWVNGKRYPRRVTTTRSPIGPQISVVLGQDQDSFGGGFDANQCFVGEICDVNMWDYVLPPETLRHWFYFNYNINGNIYGGKNGQYIPKGNVNVLKSDFNLFTPTR